MTNEKRELFDGRDLSDWTPLGEAMGAPADHDWQVAGSVDLHPEDPERFEVHDGTGIFVTNTRTDNLLTKHLHRDCELHVEFTVPENSNSGVYLMGNYEVQVLDSWGEDDLTFGTCGGIYARWVDEETVGGSPPRVNASRPPGEWQTYDVAFRAPRFDGDGRKVSNAVFEKVTWNGEVVHEDVEVEGPTRASLPGPEWPRGPLMLQGDHGPVAYRNVRITEL